MDDVDTKSVIVDELLQFKEAGGKTIVENTVVGISRDITWLKQISSQSGVHIISGTGILIIYVSKLSPYVCKIHFYILFYFGRLLRGMFTSFINFVLKFGRNS
jgi:predicted metal-dependent phosphotriesterase family hydrolase